MGYPGGAIYILQVGEVKLLKELLRVERRCLEYPNHARVRGTEE